MYVPLQSQCAMFSLASQCDASALSRDSPPLLVMITVVMAISIGSLHWVDQLSKMCRIAAYE
jgi:hypothetical protein